MIRKGTYILNPVAVIPDKVQLVTAVIIFVLSVFSSYNWGVVNDGIYHATYKSSYPISFHLFSNLIVVLLPTLLLYLVGKYFNKGTRFIDMWNTVLLSRLPLLIGYLIFFATADKELLDAIETNNIQALQNATQDAGSSMALIGMISLPLLIYSFVILFNGYRTSMYAKKPLHYILLLITIIIAEVIYRMVIYPKILTLI